MRKPVRKIRVARGVDHPREYERSCKPEWDHLEIFRLGSEEQSADPWNHLFIVDGIERFFSRVQEVHFHERVAPLWKQWERRYVRKSRKRWSAQKAEVKDALARYAQQWEDRNAVFNNMEEGGRARWLEKELINYPSMLVKCPAVWAWILEQRTRSRRVGSLSTSFQEVLIAFSGVGTKRIGRPAGVQQYLPEISAEYWWVVRWAQYVIDQRTQDESAETFCRRIAERYQIKRSKDIEWMFFAYRVQQRRQVIRPPKKIAELFVRAKYSEMGILSPSIDIRKLPLLPPPVPLETILKRKTSSTE